MTSCEKRISSLPVGRMFQRNLHASAFVLFPLAGVQTAWVLQGQMAGFGSHNVCIFVLDYEPVRLHLRYFSRLSPGCKARSIFCGFEGLGSKIKFLIKCNHSPLAL